MKRFIYTLILGAICIASSAAEPGSKASSYRVIDVYPAHDTSLAKINLKDAFTTRKYSPSSKRIRWQGSLLNIGGKTLLDPATLKETPVEPSKSSGLSSVFDFYQSVKGAANYTTVSKDVVAYTLDNNLYIRKGGEDIAITSSENKAFVHGQSVSRNEFGISGGIFPSPDGNLIAYYTKDESAVAEFPFLLTAGNGSLKSVRYPMAGCASEQVWVSVYNIASGSSVCLKTDLYGADQYLTNVSFSPDSRYVFIMVLARDQRHLSLNQYDAATGEFVKTILTEEDERYVENCTPVDFVKGSLSQFIYETNVRDGFHSLYLVNTDGRIEPLTSVKADVEYIGNDGKKAYYYSSEVSPLERHVFSVEINKKKKVRQLTRERGWHTAMFSADMKYFVDNYSSLNVPYVQNLCSGADGKVLKNIASAEDPVKDYAFCEIEMGEVASACGEFTSGYRLIKPLGFDPSKKYPLVVYVYGGPHSQMVNDSYRASLRIWEMFMAQNGYLVYCQDNRGTQYHGEAYEKAIWKQCGVAEMEDQFAGLQTLISRGFVDVERIGVHGWSYGGFMTLSLKSTKPYSDFFKVAVAGGPVIDWKWYEVMYGERYMTTPQENPEGFAKTSLVGKVGSEALPSGSDQKILVIEGMNDDTVVPQHALNFVQKCVDRDVLIDFFPYPTAPHNVMDPMNRAYLHRQISEYFFKNL